MCPKCGEKRQLTYRWQVLDVAGDVIPALDGVEFENIHDPVFLAPARTFDPGDYTVRLKVGSSPSNLITYFLFLKTLKTNFPKSFQLK